MITVTISICCMIFISIISVVYFSKKRIKNADNTIFSTLVLLHIVGMLLDISGYFCFRHFDMDSFINIFISKIYLLYYVSYIFCLTVYVYNISFKNLSKIIYYLIGALTLVSILVVALPVKVSMQDNVGYSYGAGVNLSYASIFTLLIAMIIILIINIKKIKSKKYMPIFAFVILTFFSFAVQKTYPEITLLLLSNSVVIMLMYFTIENPDVKMIKELNENRGLVEKSNEERSNLLFKISQDLRNPVSYIYEVSESLLNENSDKKIKDGIKSINNSSRRLSYVINNILDVSNIDSRNLKVVNNKYNIYTVLEEIRSRIKEQVKKGVDFRFNVSNNLPESMYGDVIKIRQIITTILSNSIKHTNSGFIELNIDSLIKYDVCRLIITVEDSGEGMNLSKVNDLLRLDEELTEEDNEKLGKLDMDLNLCKKLIKSLGGNLMIRSEEDKGSEFIVVLDQKIDDIKKNEFNKYNKSMFNKKRLLIVDDDIEEIETISSIFRKKGIDVTTSLYGKDAYDKINSGFEFDLILIDDEMPDMSGLSTLKELKTIDKFKIPSIVMLDKDKLRIKQTYLDDGFKSYLDKSKLISSIDEIVKKYL